MIFLLVSLEGGEKDLATKAFKLLDGLSEFVLTYEDKEGDWMLVGDVPWRYATIILHLGVLNMVYCEVQLQNFVN